MFHQTRKPGKKSAHQIEGFLLPVLFISLLFINFDAFQRNFEFPLDKMFWLALKLLGLPKKLREKKRAAMSQETLSASLEDYLEVIFHIVEEKQAAKAKNISDSLNVNSSSVTGALHALKEKALINYAPYDVITLTSKGKRVAKEIVQRHNALRNFLRGPCL